MSVLVCLLCILLLLNLVLDCYKSRLTHRLASRPRSTSAGEVHIKITADATPALRELRRTRRALHRLDAEELSRR